MRHLIRTAVVFALLCLLPISLCAQTMILFDNDAQTDTGFWSDDGSVFQDLADNMIFGLDSRIERFEWTGLYGEFVTDDDFSFDLYEDVGNFPELNPFYSAPMINVQRTASGEFVSAGGELFEVYEYEADVTPLMLSGNTQYWLRIQNTTNGAFWNWGADTLSGNGYFIRDFGNPDWTFDPGIDMSFVVHGQAVPEPSTALVVLGLGVAAITRRRRSCK